MAKRFRSRVGLTVFLMLPFAALAVIVGWIFYSLGDERAMEAPAVGAGAGDTGGANALGQLLRGRDAEAIEARAQALRSGAGVRPETLDGGAAIRVLRTEPTLAPGETLRLVVDSGGSRSAVPLTLHPDGGFVVRLTPGMIPEDASVRFETGDGAFVESDDDGAVALFAPLPLVDASDRRVVFEVVRLVAR